MNGQGSDGGKRDGEKAEGEAGVGGVVGNKRAKGLDDCAHRHIALIFQTPAAARIGGFKTGVRKAGDDQERARGTQIGTETGIALRLKHPQLDLLLLPNVALSSKQQVGIGWAPAAVRAAHKLPFGQLSAATEGEEPGADAADRKGNSLCVFVSITRENRPSVVVHCQSPGGW